MNLLKNRLLLPGLLIAAAMFLGLRLYSRADGGVITVCVNKNGVMHIIGEGFKRTECNKNETLLSWNIQGLPGPKGEPGSMVIGRKLVMGFASTFETINTWLDISDRNLSVEKENTNSLLKVTYDDVFGLVYNLHGACAWRLLIDDTPIAGEKLFARTSYTGSHADYTSASLSWVIQGLPAGPHEIKVQFRTGATSVDIPAATRCENGVSPQNNQLLVEEFNTS